MLGKQIRSLFAKFTEVPHAGVHIAVPAGGSLGSPWTAQFLPIPVIPALSGCTKCCTGPSGVTCTPKAQSFDDTETLPCASCLSERKVVRYFSIIDQAQSAGNMEQMLRLRCSAVAHQRQQRPGSANRKQRLCSSGCPGRLCISIRQQSPRPAQGRRAANKGMGLSKV